MTMHPKEPKEFFEEPEFLIPDPCDADWNKMTPNETGRYCSLCDKTVIDFTQMTTEQIKLYFLQTSGKKTCGHFYKGQLKTDKNKIQVFLTDLYCSASLNIRTKTVRLSVLLILSSVLALAGCNTPTDGEVIEKNHALSSDSVAPVIHDTTLKDSAKKM